MQLIKNITKEKLRGSFYTPASIADFILKWAFNGANNQDILEPSCGDGVFLKSIKNTGHKYNSITAIEIDKGEAEKARRAGLKSARIVNADFLKFCNDTKQKFDIVVGNPPYIRFQYFDRKQQEEAIAIFRDAGLEYSKLTNAWVSFVIGACQLLKEKGKIGFVLPAELLQVSYAKPVRNYLAHFFNKINIVSFKKLVFPGIQQEVVLLLCEKNGTDKHLIEHLEVEDLRALADVDIARLRSPNKTIDFKNNKWTFYFLDQTEINFLESLNKSNRVPRVKDFADVEVGITTGSNSFFTVSRSVVENYNMAAYARPLVGRSVQVNGLHFTKKDWEINQNTQAKAHLLVFPKLSALQRNRAVVDYLKIGETRGINKGYKCGIRDEWQIVPSIKISDALFIRRNNLYPRLIKNEAQVLTTDTMHRVFLKKNINPNAFISSFYNSLSFAFSEIVGRSYGGGVLELMPNEAEDILLPYREGHKAIADKLDHLIRQDKNIEEILAFSDQVILKKGFGFTDKEIKLAHNIWKKLSSRRLNRKYR